MIPAATGALPALLVCRDGAVAAWPGRWRDGRDWMTLDEPLPAEAASTDALCACSAGATIRSQIRRITLSRALHRSRTRPVVIDAGDVALATRALHRLYADPYARVHLRLTGLVALVSRSFLACDASMSTVQMADRVLASPADGVEPRSAAGSPELEQLVVVPRDPLPTDVIQRWIDALSGQRGQGVHRLTAWLVVEGRPASTLRIDGAHGAFAPPRWSGRVRETGWMRIVCRRGHRRALQYALARETGAAVRVEYAT